jgi:hypothetical protein
MNFFDFWKYKYLLSIDGTVAAYRVPALLAVSPRCKPPATSHPIAVPRLCERVHVRRERALSNTANCESVRGGTDSAGGRCSERWMHGGGRKCLR